MYQDLVMQVAARIKAEDASDLQPPATEQALERLRRRTRDELNADLPEGYLDFLRLTDGLVWNGLFLYASESAPIVGTSDEFMHSFVEDNLNWRSIEMHNDYLFFGDGDISLYAYNLVLGRYELQDRSSGTVLETFDTFDGLVTNALNSYLHMNEGEDEDDEE